MSKKDILDNKKTTKFIGDSSSYGTKNIKFFWSSNRYFKENIYHCIASSLMIIFIIILLVLIIVYAAMGGNPDVLTKYMLVPSMGIFFCLFGFALCKWYERKQRIQRIYDMEEQKNRTISSMK